MASRRLSSCIRHGVLGWMLKMRAHVGLAAQEMRFSCLPKLHRVSALMQIRVAKIMSIVRTQVPVVHAVLNLVFGFLQMYHIYIVFPRYYCGHDCP